MPSDARRFADATTRNREPILRVLERVVPNLARVLEVASGTGQHAAFFAERLAVESWQPSDPCRESRASIDAWREYVGARKVRPALDFDVTRDPWPGSPSVVVCINMIHIAPWRACEALLEGAARTLPVDGVVFLYGPYRRDGAHTAASNEAFDTSLRARNPAWGVRDLETVTAFAEERGLARIEVVEMPANNLSVVLRKRAPR